MVDHALKRRGGISKAKGHNLVLIMSIASSKGSLMFVALLNTYVIKSYREVERGILLRLSDPFSHFYDKW